MKISNPFCDLTQFEKILWGVSMVIVGTSYLFSGGEGILSAIASLIGVTALIFVAKGYVFGQILTVIFAIFYGIISFFLSYYGEMITYLCMSAPAALVTIVEWLRHPYKGTKEVKVGKLTKAHIAAIVILSALVTAAFYFILRALGNASLIVSTISVTTSFIASALTFCRSPYYALAYTANDIVLIILWILAAMQSLSYLPMVLCFIMFLFNDIYGFYSWKRMENRQT